MTWREAPAARWGRAPFGFFGLILLAVAIFGAPSASAAPPTPAPASAAAVPSAAELQSLVDTLQNDRSRTALLSQLRTLLAAERAARAPGLISAAPAAGAVEPADVIAELSGRLSALTQELLAGVAVLLDAPRLFSWLEYQIGHPASRALWRSLLLDCTIVFGLALAAEWVVRRALTRLGREPPVLRRDLRLVRFAFAALGLVVEMLPVAAFAGAAAVAMATVLPEFSLGRAAISLLVQAIVIARLIAAAARAVLVPRPAWPSIVPASEETRNYLLIWARRLTWWALVGYGVAGAAWWLGVPGAIYALMLKFVALGIAVFAVILVVQNREQVACWISGPPANGAEQPPGDIVPNGPPANGSAPAGWERLRHWFGDTWHIVAIVYIGAIYLAYALHDERGTAFVLGATVESAVTLVGARLLGASIRRLSESGLAISPELRVRLPLLEQRANRYLPVAIGAAIAILYVLAAGIVLQAWQLPVFEWLAAGFGRRIAGALLSSVLVLAIAVAVWEILAATIERHLAALDHEGAPSRARRRTLLPLFRTVMACTIATIAGLVILSQIGIDIAPLLAGAGVVGLAVGFGSQALIKDIITGLFILVEDQMAVGDIVDVGKEHVGVVEAITIRTIRLRDLSGVVHTVPFSDVTSVKNLTRDFAYAIARVTVAYGEDIDRVVEILRGVCDTLAQDPQTGPLILDPFDYKGVESLNEFSVVLLLRVRTLPAQQWVVGRALNRLIKIAFDEHGIAMRDPSPVMVQTAVPAAAVGEPARS